MNGTDVAFMVLSPLLWIGYVTLDHGPIGAMMGFGAMFATVYALLSLVSWLLWRMEA